METIMKRALFETRYYSIFKVAIQEIAKKIKNLIGFCFKNIGTGTILVLKLRII